MDDNTIRIKLIEHGETFVDVERHGYEAAKANGELDQFLDVYASDMETETIIVEENGAEIRL